MTMMAGEISDLVLERGLGSIWLSSFLLKFSMGRRQLWLLTAQLIKCCYETSPACNEKIISFSCIVMIFFRYKLKWFHNSAAQDNANQAALLTYHT